MTSQSVLYMYIIMVKLSVKKRESRGRVRKRKISLKSYGAPMGGYFYVKMAGFNFESNLRKEKGVYEGRKRRSSLLNPFEKIRLPQRSNV